MSLSTPADPIQFRAARPNVSFNGLRSSTVAVFFGHTLGVDCQRCGAYEQNDMGHRYCAQIACPIALIEFKRRKRKRTSNLEKVYAPRFTRAKPVDAVDASSSPSPS